MVSSRPLILWVCTKSLTSLWPEERRGDPSERFGQYLSNQERLQWLQHNIYSSSKILFSFRGQCHSDCNSVHRWNRNILIQLNLANRAQHMIPLLLKDLNSILFHTTMDYRYHFESQLKTPLMRVNLKHPLWVNSHSPLYLPTRGGRRSRRWGRVPRRGRRGSHDCLNNIHCHLHPYPHLHVHVNPHLHHHHHPHHQPDLPIGLHAQQHRGRAGTEIKRDMSWPASWN